MNILLINPPRFNEIIGNNPAIIEEERGLTPPLGLLYLAGYLEAYSKHRIEVIDAQAEKLTYKQLSARLSASRADVIGLTAMTMTIIDVLETVRLSKLVLPGVKIVLGGPHVYLFPEETMSQIGVDYLVLGEGEKAFLSLIDAIDDADRLRQIPGLVFRSGEDIIRTNPPMPIENLDDLPHPARHMTPYTKYSSLLSTGETVTTLFTSRGCPYKCRFCDRPHLGKHFRSRSALNVVDEIEICVRMGIREFLIYDDTFTVNHQRVMDICDLITQRKLDILFDVRARVDTVSKEMLSKLRHAGCQGIHYGVEAGTDRILKSLNKGINLQQVTEVFDLTKQQGIPTLAYFMIGNPGETEEDIACTFKLARRLKPDFLHMTILTPFPGTQIYFEALESGIIERDVWRDFATNPKYDFTPPHWGEFFAREELEELLVYGYKRFYLRPGYILKRISKIKNWSEFKKKAKAGIQVAGMKSQRHSV